MIKFNCPGCQNEFQIPKESAGMKGKCPQCQEIIVVPEHSIDTLIFDESAITCKDEKVNELYDYLINKSSVPILNHSISEFDNMDYLKFIIGTGDHRERRQEVTAVHTEVHTSTSAIGQIDNCIYIQSEIGNIISDDMGDTLVTLFEKAYWSFFCSVVVKEGLAKVRCGRMLEFCSRKEFAILVHLVAIYADEIKKEIFKWDIE